MAFEDNLTLRENVLDYLARVSVNPDERPWFERGDYRGPVFADELHKLLYGKERPSPERLVKLVQRNRFSAAANPGVRGMASKRKIGKNSGRTLRRDCRNILVAVSYSPLTRQELVALFNELHPELRENPVGCKNRVKLATKALAEVGALIGCKHGFPRTLPLGLLAVENLAPEVQEEVQAFQELLDKGEANLETLERMLRPHRIRQPSVKHLE